MIWGVLVLSPIALLATCLLGFALIAALMRRPLVKSLFNLGSYAIAGTGLMVVYYALDDGAGTFSVRSISALLIAALVFAGLNLLLLSGILFAAGDVPPREFLGEQWGLSIGMAVGSVGVSTMALSIVQNTPSWPRSPPCPQWPSGTPTGPAHRTQRPASAAAGWSNSDRPWRRRAGRTR